MVDEKDMARERAEFVRDYLEPAVKSLAQRYKVGEPLDEIDRKILSSCGYDPDYFISGKYAD